MKVGIIGCGAITIRRHAPEYGENPDAIIGGFFDANPDRAALLAEKYGGRVYQAIDEMLCDSTIDAVSVCTPNFTHAEISIKALNHGKHVLCEKPMATTVEDAIAMDEAARKNGCILMMGQNQRLAPAHQRVKAMLESGQMGKVLRFETSFGHAGPESWGIDKSTNTWFFNKNQAHLGAMGDLGIHKIDLIAYMLGDRFTSVRALVTTIDKRDGTGELIGVDDNTLCILTTESGTIGTLCASWTNYGIEDNSTKLYCQNGIIKIYDNPDYPIQIFKKDGEKEYIVVGQIQTNDNQTKTGIIDLFVDTVINGKPSPISGRECIHVLKVVTAALESSKTGRAVEI